MNPESLNEAQMAGRALALASGKVNESLNAFSGWLMLGVGSAFSLIITNVEKLNQYIQLYHIKITLFLLLISLGFAVVLRLLSAMISAGANSHEAGTQLGYEIAGLDRPFNINLFIKEYLRGFYFPIRCIVNSSLNKAKSGDSAASGRMLVKLSQAQVLLVFCQMVLILAAAGELTIGLQIH